MRVSNSAGSALDESMAPIIRALKVIVRAHLLVTTERHPGFPGGLIAELRMAPGPWCEVQTARGRGRLWIGCRQRVRVLPGDRADAPFRVEVVSATYQILSGDGQTRLEEIVSYHWTPDDPTAKRTWPHLHIGSAFIDPAARREPWTLHKTHFVTGSISAAAFVRMAVEEFDVQPLVDDWAARLDAAETGS